MAWQTGYSLSLQADRPARSDASQCDVLAGFANLRGNQSATLEEAKDRTTQAKAEERLKRRRNDQQREEDPRSRLEPCEKKHDGGTAQSGPHTLREALRRTSHQFGVPDAGGQDLDREQGERRNPGAEKDTEPETDCHSNQAQGRACQQCCDSQQYNKSGRNPGGVFIDRIGKGEDDAPVNAGFPWANGLAYR